MRVMVVYNPVSGSGRAAELATGLVERLHGRRLGPDPGELLEVRAAPSRPEDPRRWLDPLLEGIGLLVVVGGDGAVRLAAASAIRADVPLYHFPAGTENLFARDHGMRADPAVLLHAIEHGSTRRLDVFRVDGELGLLFASVGFDAEVVQDLSVRRTGSIRHLSYLPPILRQLLAWRRIRPRIHLEVDGRSLGAPRHGLGLVANSPQYALRLNPARGARPDDGQLDVLLLPARTFIGLLAWAVRCRLGRAGPGAMRPVGRGRRVTLELDRPAHLQIDGDPARGDGPRARYEVLLEPGVLPIRSPSSENHPPGKKIPGDRGNTG